jgi:hypothetical protein
VQPWSTILLKEKREIERGSNNDAEEELDNRSRRVVLFPLNNKRYTREA